MRSQVGLSLSREDTFVSSRSALAKTLPERVSGLVRRPTSFRPRFSRPFGGREEEEVMTRNLPNCRAEHRPLGPPLAGLVPDIR